MRIMFRNGTKNEFEDAVEEACEGDEDEDDIEEGSLQIDDKENDDDLDLLIKTEVTESDGLGQPPMVQVKLLDKTPKPKRGKSLDVVKRRRRNIVQVFIIFI